LAFERPKSALHSRDAKRFVKEHLLLAFEAIGIPPPPPPEFWPVHNYWRILQRWVRARLNNGGGAPTDG
jgi:hypothetical protein